VKENNVSYLPVLAAMVFTSKLCWLNMQNKQRRNGNKILHLTRSTCRNNRTCPIHHGNRLKVYLRYH
jgi:hypothetical protein